MRRMRERERGDRSSLLPLAYANVQNLWRIVTSCAENTREACVCSTMHSGIHRSRRPASPAPSPLQSLSAPGARHPGDTFDSSTNTCPSWIDVRFSDI